MWGVPNRKYYLKIIDTLIGLGYGSYNELVENTARDIDDMFVAIQSKQQQETLRQAGL